MPFEPRRLRKLPDESGTYLVILNLSRIRPMLGDRLVANSHTLEADGLTRLTVEEQKAVKIKAFDLRLNPVNSGIQLHESKHKGPRTTGRSAIFAHVKASSSIFLSPPSFLRRLFEALPRLSRGAPLKWPNGPQPARKRTRKFFVTPFFAAGRRACGVALSVPGRYHCIFAGRAKPFRHVDVSEMGLNQQV